jgi:hypothetical protein
MPGRNTEGRPPHDGFHRRTVFPALELHAPFQEWTGHRPCALNRIRLLGSRLGLSSREPERSRQLAVLDAAPVGLIQALLNFLPVFLVRLGGSSLQVGLLTSLPALAGMLLAIPMGQFWARQTRLVQWTAVLRVVWYSACLFTGLLPFFGAWRQPDALVALWGLAAVPQAGFAVGIISVLGAVTGTSGSMGLLGRRWSLAAAVTAAATLIIGLALHQLPFPLNYQIVYLVFSTLGMWGSYVVISRVRLPETGSTGIVPGPLWAALRRQGRQIRANGPFLRFMIAAIVLHSGRVLPLPLFPLYWVRGLHASDATISVIAGTQTAATIAGYLVWARLGRARGQSVVMLASVLGVSLYPLLTALTRDAGWLVLWAGLAGFCAAGIELANFDILFSTCLPEERPVYVGIYQTIVFLANFIAPLLGIGLESTFGLRAALVVGFVLRLISLGLLATLRVGQGNRPAVQTGTQAA